LVLLFSILVISLLLVMLDLMWSPLPCWSCLDVMCLYLYCFLCQADHVASSLAQSVYVVKINVMPSIQGQVQQSVDSTHNSYWIVSFHKPWPGTAIYSG
jgi:hypothetical protein